MSAPRPSEATSPAPNDDSRRGLLCVHCGYDLRGLDADAVCPECRTSIARSLQGDSLASADPAWLHRVCRGQTLIAIACVVLVLRVPLLMVAGLALPLIGRTVPWFWEVAEFVSGIGALTCLLVGVLMVTSLDPRLSLSEQPLGLRRITQAAAIAALVVLIVRSALHGMTGASAGMASAFEGPTSFAYRALLACAVIGLSLHLSRLAARIPDAALARRLDRRARFAVVCFGGAILDRAFFRTGYALMDDSYLLTSLRILTGLCTLLSVFVGLALIVAWWHFGKALRAIIAARPPGTAD